ncbi:MAG: hypothetical protein ABGX16_02700 [Pirellulales bacterium]
MKLPKKILIVIAILTVGGMIAIGMSIKSQQQAVVEAATRQALNEIGVLVTMDSNRQHVQGIALLPSTQQEVLEQTIQLVAKLPQLEVLRLLGTRVTDKQLTQISTNTSLTMLGLSKTNIGDMGLKQLRSLSNLQALYLAATRVTDQGLESVGKLHSLEILDLSKTSLEGDLASLLPLDQLSHLLLSDVSLSDAAVANLLQLKSLSRLTILGSTLSEKADNKLDQAGIKIDRESEPDIEHADGTSGEPTEDNSLAGEDSSSTSKQ